jgi:hypothetical protein
MLGKELDDLSFKELQHLEEQLSEGILSVKDKKVLNFILTFLYFFSSVNSLLIPKV